MAKQTVQPKSAKGASNVKAAKTKEVDEDSFIDEEVLGGASSYMKLQDGDNEVRIISKPIFGWIGWEDKKPQRTLLADGPPDVTINEPKDKPKKFMACLVIDLADDEIKIMELTQQSIIKAILALDKNAKWGKPYGYNLSINKTGANLTTKYVVTPNPKTPVSSAHKAAATEKPCNLMALYEGADPWSEEATNDEVTPYIFK